MPKTISACLIVKNEEQFLEDTLNSIKDLVDEIIVVDTGSTDNTVRIAKNFTEKVFSFTWKSDFSAARNFSLKKATGDWILAIDGDEVISKKDHVIIRKIIDAEKFPAVSIVQRNYTGKTQQPLFKEADERYNEEARGFPGYIPVEVIRLFKNNRGITFLGFIHESVDQSIKKLGLKFLRTDIPFHHYQHLKPKERHEEKLKGYISLLEKKEKESPLDIKNLHDLAIVYLEQKRDVKRAFEFFKKIYELDQNLLESYLGMGIIYARTNQLDKAVTIFTKSLNNKTTKTIEMRINHEQIRQTILFNLAQCFEQLGNKDKAKEYYELLLKTKFPMQEKVKQRLSQLTS